MLPVQPMYRNMVGSLAPSTCSDLGQLTWLNQPGPVNLIQANRISLRKPAAVPALHDYHLIALV